MRSVTIHSREDGIVALAPEQRGADAADRAIVIGTVLLASASLFVCGAMPAEVLAAIAASSLAGEVVLGLAALARRLLRPAAEVLDLARCRPQRR